MYGSSHSLVRKIEHWDHNSYSCFAKKCYLNWGIMGYCSTKAIGPLNVAFTIFHKDYIFFMCQSYVVSKATTRQPWDFALLNSSDAINTWFKCTWPVRHFKAPPSGLQDNPPCAHLCIYHGRTRSSQRLQGSHNHKQWGWRCHSSFSGLFIN